MGNPLLELTQLASITHQRVPSKDLSLNLRPNRSRTRFRYRIIWLNQAVLKGANSTLSPPFSTVKV